jgi:hypothetical protein
MEERVTFPYPTGFAPLASTRPLPRAVGEHSGEVFKTIRCITRPTSLADPCPVPGGTSSPWKNHFNPTSKPPSPKRQPPSPLAPRCSSSLRAPTSIQPQLDPSPRHQNAYKQSSEINRDRPRCTTPHHRITLGRRAFSWCVYLALALVDPPEPPRSWTPGPGVVGHKYPLGASPRNTERRSIRAQIEAGRGRPTVEGQSLRTD